MLRRRDRHVDFIGPLAELTSIGQMQHAAFQPGKFTPRKRDPATGAVAIAGGRARPIHQIKAQVRVILDPGFPPP